MRDLVHTHTRDPLRCHQHTDPIPPPHARQLPGTPDRPAPLRHQPPLRNVLDQFERAFPYTFTLTATIPGRERGDMLRTSSFNCFASNGQKFRQRGSIKVTITGRPR